MRTITDDDLEPADQHGVRNLKEPFVVAEGGEVVLVQICNEPRRPQRFSLPPRSTITSVTSVLPRAHR